MMKKKIIIIATIAILLIGAIIATVVIVTKPKDEEKPTSIVEKGEVPTSPAENTESLLTSMDEIETISIDTNTIDLTSTKDVKKGDLIAVWVYSEPKFLGYFKVIEKEGKKLIEGLEEALSKLDIDPGDHNIALVKETGEKLGYIDIKIEDNKIKVEEKEEKPTPETDTDAPVFNGEQNNNYQEKTTKKNVKVNEAINYTTTKQNEQNMKNGTTAVVQAGSVGTKEVTYEVTYDKDGKEISRKKLSEKVTKEPVNEIIKVGTSDFNINTDTTRGHMSGPACTKDKSYDAPWDGAFHCNDETYKDLPQFNATIMSGKIIVTSINGKLTTAVIATPVNDYVFMGTYNGQTYYFDNRMGDGEPGTLTMDFCNEYNLKCGQW